MEKGKLQINIPPIETRIPKYIYYKLYGIIEGEINKLNDADEIIAPYIFPVENIQKIADSDKIDYKENIRNLADDLWTKEQWLDALIVYYILMHIITFLPTDFYKLGYTLAKFAHTDMALELVNIYETTAANKKVACHAIANFYYTALDMPEKAIDYFEKYLEFDPNNALVYNSLAHLYSRFDDDEMQEKRFNALVKAYELKPEDPVILKSLLTLYEKQHNTEKVKELYPKLIEIAPSPRHSLNYGLYLISWGELYEGHKHFIKRFELDEYPIGYPKGIFSGQTLWNYRDDLSDKILVIHYEEGFGDSIMYGRFLPLIKQYAKKTVLIVQKPLVELFKASPILSEGVDILSDIKEFLSKYKDEKYVHMPLMDMPFPLGVDSCFIPYSDSYIKAPCPRKFDKSKINIGIAYSGDTTSNYNARNIELKEFYDIARLDGVKLYSLQVGEASNQLSQLPEDIEIEDLGKELNDFVDTANAIAGLDFIISSDNVVLNLAGAMGKLTLGVFNKYPNYRWFDLSGDNVKWYDSVNPFQCKEENDWAPVMKEVEESIKEVLKSGWVHKLVGTK